MIKIGKYELVQRIATTNTNNIYKVLYDDQFLIMKRLRDSASLQDENRIKQEALFLSKINSDKVIAIKSFFEGNFSNNSYIILEYFKGITLENYLSLKTQLSPEQTYNIIYQVALGLVAIHHNKIVHQDIGLKNLMINDDGNIKIIDFGAAKNIGDPSINMLMQAHGTAYYISPETVMAKNITEKSDIYSLGLIFSELLTGEKVFNGIDDKDIAVARVIKPEPPLSAKLPESIRPLIVRMLAFEPQTRPSAQEVADELSNKI